MGAKGKSGRGGPDRGPAPALIVARPPLLSPGRLRPERQRLYGFLYCAYMPSMRADCPEVNSNMQGSSV